MAGKKTKTKTDPTAASRLESIRDAHNVQKLGSRTTCMEDYLEVIYELMAQKGYATTVDISNYLNVSSPSAPAAKQERLHQL